jgi:hypothetical protein
MTQVDNYYYTFRKPVNYLITATLDVANTFPYATTSLEAIAQEAAKSLESQVYNQEHASLLAFNQRITLGFNSYSRFATNSTPRESNPYTDSALNAYKNSKYIKRVYHEQAAFITFNPDSQDSWNYLPSYKLSNLGTYNEKPVVSHYSSLLYDQFDNISVFSFPNVTHAYSNAARIFYSDFSVKFHNNFCLHGDQSVRTDSRELLFSTIWNDTNFSFNFEHPQKVIQTVSACSGPKYEFKLTELSSKQLNKNSGAFIPVLVPIQYMSPHFPEVVDAYFFTFYYNLPTSKISKYSKPKKYIKDFFKECFTTFGVSFYDLDYTAKLKAYALKEYANSGYPSLIAKLFQENDLEIASLDSPRSTSPISPENYSNFFSSIKLPDSFLRRQLNFQSKEDKYVGVLQEKSESFNNSLASIYNLKVKQRRILSRIKDYENQITDLKKTLAEIQSSAANYEDIKGFLGHVDSFLNVAPVLNQKKQDLQVEKHNLLSSSALTVDQTYINLMKKFDLHSITLIDASGSETVYDTLNLDFTLDLIKDREIKSVLFSTKEPSKIKVSGSGREEIVGGPYLVEATKHRLNVSLKDTTSWFGWNDNISSSSGNMPAYIHPHASSTRVLSVYSYTASACLGEASSMLYKAFENKNLKEIFMVANVWLCSANKTDVWGKNYKYFTPYQTYLESLSLQNIPQETLETFEYPSQNYLTFISQPSAASSGTFSSPLCLNSQEVEEELASSYQPYSTLTVQNESEF